MMINIENYEEFVLDYLEDNLDPETRESFITFLMLHPDIKYELEEFHLIHLEADSSIQFPDKSKLLQVPEQESRKKIIGIWWYAGIAASFSLLLFLGYSIFKSSSSEALPAIAREEANLDRVEETMLESSDKLEIEIPENIETPTLLKVEGLAKVTEDNILSEHQSQTIIEHSTDIQEPKLVFTEKPVEDSQELDDVGKVETNIYVAVENINITILPSIQYSVSNQADFSIDDIEFTYINTLNMIPEEKSGFRKLLAKINILPGGLPDKEDLKESLVPEFIAMR